MHSCVSVRFAEHRCLPLTIFLIWDFFPPFFLTAVCKNSYYRPGKVFQEQAFRKAFALVVFHGSR